jgi:HAD superfamily hydrolase (TIGR01490 family)
LNRRIAFFDFDGTITTKDTLLEFIKFYKGKRKFYLGFLLYSPLLVAFKLKIIPNYVAKQKVIQHFFKGESVDTFLQYCNAFSEKVLPGLIRPKALHEIKKLKAADARIVIVSASAENWIAKWANSQGLQLIGTRLATNGETITGAFDGNNCYGNEKVCRIKAEIDLSVYDEVYCYGDSAGDKAMLQLANHPFYKPFR